MKALILALTLISTAALAREGHDGPEASPIAPSPVIAKAQWGSGFVPPGVAVSTTVEIHADGQIMRIEAFQGTPDKFAAVATLAPDVVANIANSVAHVKASKIVDPNPRSPGCMDAPVETYSAVQGLTEIIVAQRANCKDMKKINQTQSDLQVKNALDIAIALSNLAP